MSKGLTSDFRPRAKPQVDCDPSWVIPKCRDLQAMGSGWLQDETPGYEPGKLCSVPTCCYSGKSSHFPLPTVSSPMLHDVLSTWTADVSRPEVHVRSNLHFTRSLSGLWQPSKYNCNSPVTVCAHYFEWKAPQRSLFRVTVVARRSRLFHFWELASGSYSAPGHFSGRISAFAFLLKPYQV